MGRVGHHNRSRRLRQPPNRFAAWLLVFVMGLQALAPIGQALAFDAAKDVNFVYVCTSDGIKKVAIDENGMPVSEPSLDERNLSSCLFCTTHAAPALLQPDALSTPMVSAGVVKIALTLPANSHHGSIWRSTSRPPRAPPLFV